jgi:hypothetical protein
LIATLLRGYLHEDWDADYETAAEARDAFLQDISADERQAFAVECDAFHRLTAGLSLRDLSRVLQDSLESAWQPASTTEVRAVLSARERGRG